jgi:hypothetical protein
MIRILVALVLIGLMAWWILWPAWVRHRDNLQSAPEMKDASFRVRFLMAFQGLRTKMAARAFDAIGVLTPIYNALSILVSGEAGIDLNTMLPAIPVGALMGTDAVMTGSQWAPALMLGVGRLFDYLRSISNTRAGTIDPALAIEAATASKEIAGSVPSPSIAALCDTGADNAGGGMRVAGADRRAPRKAAAKRRAKVKAR